MNVSFQGWRKQFLCGQAKSSQCVMLGGGVRKHAETSGLWEQRISKLDVLYEVKGQYVPILTLYQRYFQLSEFDHEGNITICNGTVLYKISR